MNNKKYITGQRFGLLVVVKPTENTMRGGVVWELICDCGITVFRNTHSLTRSKRENLTSSCGCYHSRELIKHGSALKGAHTKEYVAWCSMKTRCSNHNFIAFKHYGGRGIKVCERWIDSFENFIADMGIKPSPKHSLDRIDVNRNYEPSNCRWVTQSEQVRNRRMRVTISGCQGVTWHKCSQKWCAYIPINNKSKHLGLFSSLEDAIAARKAAELKYWTTEQHPICTTQL